jgi:hypothetical protein
MWIHNLTKEQVKQLAVQLIISAEETLDDIKKQKAK